MDKIGRGGFGGFVFAEIGSWRRAWAVPWEVCDKSAPD
jgi:hypothetical protein